MNSDFVIKNGILTHYRGSDTQVTIPGDVTSIGKRAFYGCKSLTSVSIPSSVTSIGDSAFSGCSSLTSVSIPDGVTSIGGSAFYHCESLTSVSIPDSVTSIGIWAFDGCKSLFSVSIPDSVTSIGYYAFRDCISLTSVSIPDSVTNIEGSAFNGCMGLADIHGLVIVRDTVYDCKRDAIEISIPDSVTSIGYGAFRDCKSLTSVSIPDSVTSIGDYAFYGCKSLSSVSIPDSVTNIWESAFEDCSSLTSVSIPDSVTSIEDYAFYGCKSLTSVSIPDSVTSILESAFQDCSSLTSVSIPDSLTHIGKSAFRGCKSLTRLELYCSIDSKTAKEARLNLSQLNQIVTDDVKKIPTTYRPIAAATFAEENPDCESERGKNHLKYIKSNVEKLAETAVAHPALLRLMCARKLLKAENVEAYFACAQKAGKKNTEAIALLLDYQQNKLTSKEKEKAAAKTEAKEEKVVDFVFSATAAEELQGKTFVVTGKLNTMTREEFKACLDACGAILSETLNSDTDYLITNTPSSGSAKNRKAEALGVKKLSEAEFNKLIGREE